MTFNLRKATASDASALTKIYLDAFSLDAISLRVFPRNQPDIYTWWDTNITEELKDLYSHTICITETSPSPSHLGEKIVAFAKWNDTTTPLEGPNPSLPTWPTGADTTLANHFFGTMAQKHEGIMKGRKHWYLEMVCVLPEYQGKGLGGRLLRWGLERADEEGTECYLEASPAGKEIYEYMGFVEVDRLVVELDGKGNGKGDGEGESVLGEREFVECFMVRGVNGKKS